MASFNVQFCSNLSFQMEAGRNLWMDALLWKPSSGLLLPPLAPPHLTSSHLLLLPPPPLPHSCSSCDAPWRLDHVLKTRFYDHLRRVPLRLMERRPGSGPAGPDPPHHPRCWGGSGRGRGGSGARRPGGGGARGRGGGRAAHGGHLWEEAGGAEEDPASHPEPPLAVGRGRTAAGHTPSPTTTGPPSPCWSWRATDPRWSAAWTSCWRRAVSRNKSSNMNCNGCACTLSMHYYPD